MRGPFVDFVVDRIGTWAAGPRSKSMIKAMPHSQRLENRLDRYYGPVWTYNILHSYMGPIIILCIYIYIVQNIHIYIYTHMYTYIYMYYVYTYICVLYLYIYMFGSIPMMPRRYPWGCWWALPPSCCTTWCPSRWLSFTWHRWEDWTKNSGDTLWWFNGD